MYHVDVPNSQIPAGSEVLCIGWFRVKMEDKARFDQQCAQYITSFDDHLVAAGKGPAGGWRIEKSDDMENEEQWVQFWGLDRKAERNGSVLMDDNFISSLVLGSELKTGSRMDVEPVSLNAQRAA